MLENSRWIEFYKRIDSILKTTIDRNIIIFGSSQSGEFVRWFYYQFYGKEVKGIVDRWESDAHYHISHMMSFYYLYDEKDVIINALPENFGPRKEFANIGEDWSKTGYLKEQIINLWDEIFTEKNIGDENNHAITFYNYLEFTENIDLLTVITRKSVKGKFAHGYYPTDFRLIYTVFRLDNIFDKERAILDIGCGKGASLIALYEFG